jgi:pimeloyl-ACP methyl ester carboxylesterase
MDVLIALAVAAAAAAVALALVTRLLVLRAERRAPALGRTVTAGGVSLHYVDEGEGPPVVFLHGAKGSVYDATLSVGPELARDHRVVAFDRPGSGYSGRAAARNGDPGVQAGLLRDAMSTLGIARPVLVAHSAGAPVALALALEHPAEVSAVVTLGGYVFPARDPGRAPNRILVTPVVGALLRWTVLVPLGLLLSRVVVRHVFAPGAPDSAYAHLAPGLALRPDRMACDARDLPDVEAGLRALAARYGELSVPVVAVHGLADYVVSAAQAVRLCERVPGCDLVLLEETGHMPHFTRPDAVLEAVDLAYTRAGAPDAAGAGGDGAADESAVTFAPPAPAAYTPALVALGGEPAVPGTRNPLQRG